MNILRFCEICRRGPEIYKVSFQHGPRIVCYKGTTKFTMLIFRISHKKHRLTPEICFVTTNRNSHKLILDSKQV